MVKAAVLCAYHWIGEIALALDANPFPDARPQSFVRWNMQFALGIGLPVKIRAPFCQTEQGVTREDFKHLRIDHRRRLITGKGMAHEARQRCDWLMGRGRQEFPRSAPSRLCRDRADAEKWMRKIPTTLFVLR